MSSHIKSVRLRILPTAIRRELVEARRQKDLSQADLGKHIGLPQTHISGIETGKVVPRFDTLLDLVRVLDRDLLIVPRELVPAVQSLIRSHRHSKTTSGDPQGERSLYAEDADSDAD